jgi:hypothetical protein
MIFSGRQDDKTVYGKEGKCPLSFLVCNGKREHPIRCSLFENDVK